MRRCPLGERKRGTPALTVFYCRLSGCCIVAGAYVALLIWTIIEVVMVTPAAARRIAQAYGQWGRGQHRAALNFGDCFAYEVAKEHACRLLFVGDDFSKTDIEGVLSNSR